MPECPPTWNRGSTVFDGECREAAPEIVQPNVLSAGKGPHFLPGAIEAWIKDRGL